MTENLSSNVLTDNQLEKIEGSAWNLLDELSDNAAVTVERPADVEWLEDVTRLVEWAQEMRGTLTRLRDDPPNTPLECSEVAAAVLGDTPPRSAVETSASHRGPYCQSKPGDWMDGWGACKVCGGEIPDGHITECAHWKLQVANRRMREALQQWRDACSCGCDACVELIETLSLESAAEHGQEKRPSRPLRTSEYCTCGDDPIDHPNPNCPIHGEPSPADKMP